MAKILAWLMSFILLCACLGGCQLAREDAGVQDTIPKDRLVGVYITGQPLDSTKEYYAQEFLIEEDGYETTSFEFEDVPGIALFSAIIKPENDPDGYTATIGSDELMDKHSHISITDEGQELHLTGTVYTLQSMILYINQVYQAPTGEIYMVSGDGFHTSGLMSATTEETRENEDGKYSAKMEITQQAVDEPVQEVFKEINANDEVIRTRVITPDNIPDSINIHPDCAYTIVETHSQGDDGIEITRILLDIEEGYYTYMYPGERGFLTSKFIEIQAGDDHNN